MTSKDTAALLVGANRRMTDALKDLNRWVQTLKGADDPNVRRVAGSMERIIDEAL